jgi:quercetin dioxygenase-like cupin family protein
MIVRNARNRESLKVHDLNQIVVLLDRSETALTEVGINSWPAGIMGPPHAHTQKEQVFLILSGSGKVIAGGKTFPAAAGDIIYVPPGVQHQTLADARAPLVYFLYNGFLDSSKEGHASFADHIEKVRDDRKAQAAGLADSGAAPVSDKVPVATNLEKGEQTFDFGANLATVLLDRSLTLKNEVVLVSWPPHRRGPMAAHPEKEQTFYVLSGTGTVTVDNETQPVAPGDVVHIPVNAPHTTEAGSRELRYVVFNTFITDDRAETFAKHATTVAPMRKARWEDSDPNVGV